MNLVNATQHSAIHGSANHTRYDYRSPRLYVAAPLVSDAVLTLEKPQAHYLRNVLRLKANGLDSGL